MAFKSPEPYLEPVSEGVCEVLDCSSRAAFRASWAQGVIIKLLCPAHKAKLQGELFQELNPALFRRKHAK